MHAIKRVAAISALLGLASVAYFYFDVFKSHDQMSAPATSRHSRQQMLATDPDAIILSSFVTGDVPRLLREEALETWSDALWFTDNATLGNIVRAPFYAMDGVPFHTEIGTAFSDGKATEAFSCITVDCKDWPTKQSRYWGLNALRGQEDAIGPEVTLENHTFTEYDTYLDAHARVVSDPFQWFSEVGAQIVQPRPDELRLVVVTLPTLLVSETQSADFGKENETISDQMTKLANDLMDGSGGEVTAVLGTKAMPLWVAKDGTYLRAIDGGTRRLPGYAIYNPVFRLNMPVEAVPDLREKLAEEIFPDNDISMLDPAIADAFVAWGIDTDCLPECGGIIPSQEFRNQSEVNVAQAPFWMLSVYRVPPPN